MADEIDKEIEDKAVEDAKIIKGGLQLIFNKAVDEIVFKCVTQHNPTVGGGWGENDSLCEHLDGVIVLMFVGPKGYCNELQPKLNAMIKDYMEGQIEVETEKDKTIH